MNSWTAEARQRRPPRLALRGGQTRTKFDGLARPAGHLRITRYLKHPSAHPYRLDLATTRLADLSGEDTQLTVRAAPVIHELGHAPAALDPELFQDLQVGVGLGEPVPQRRWRGLRSAAHRAVKPFKVLRTRCVDICVGNTRDPWNQSSDRVNRRVQASEVTGRPAGA